MRRALAILDSLGETGSLNYDGYLASLASSLDQQGHQREASLQYRRTLFLMDSAGAGETIDRAIFEHNYGLILSELGESARAEETLHDVLTRLARSDPTSHLPQQPLIHYAQIAYDNWHSDSAEKYFGILARQADQEHNSYWAGRALFGLAEAQLQKGDLAAARGTMRRFRAVADNPKLRNTDDHILDSRILDARVALAGDDFARAFDLVMEALHARGYPDGARKRVMREALLLAAEAALGAQRPDSALRLARDAREMATLDSITDTRSARVGEARLVEGRALLARGDTVTARATLVRALEALRTAAGAAHPLTRETGSLLAALPH